MNLRPVAPDREHPALVGDALAALFGEGSEQPRPNEGGEDEDEARDRRDKDGGPFVVKAHGLAFAVERRGAAGRTEATARAAPEALVICATKISARGGGSKPEGVLEMGSRVKRSATSSPDTGSDRRRHDVTGLHWT